MLMFLSEGFRQERVHVLCSILLVEILVRYLLRPYTIHMVLFFFFYKNKKHSIENG